MQRLRYVVLAALVRAVPLFCALSGVEIAALGGNAAHAQDFDSAHEQANEVRTPETLAAVLWSFVASCDAIDNDFEKRQCQGVQLARQAQVSGKTFYIAGEAGVLAAADFDAKKRAIALELRGCVACAGAVSLAGKSLYIVGRGAPRIAGNAVVGATAHTTAVAARDAEAADKWRADVLPRLRTELLFRVPARTRAWSKDDVQGVSVDIVGYRIVDPCTGKVVASKPKSQPVAADESACTGDDLAALIKRREAEARAKEPPKPTGPVVPERLTPIDIQESLKPATDSAQECYAIYGVSGEARFRITIDQHGQVVKLEQLGDFVDTPTGTCIEDVVKKAVFPRSRKEATTVNYPFVLR